MGLLKQQAINDRNDNWKWKLGGAWVEFSVRGKISIAEALARRSILIGVGRCPMDSFGVNKPYVSHLYNCYNYCFLNLSSFLIIFLKISMGK
ncbi:hypothetical protein HanXRQr2_Chr03g0116001 [Helianthus annuus]|uniref:Uncharacterized protein n=1 Tax=Helianthus annuus TaxID=4232 RepID=A0A9K3JI00_HELAN|nr:hypothetical protein HanXRQr2_Chr03g0116001 [Helianthus annuus]